MNFRYLISFHQNLHGSLEKFGILKKQKTKREKKWKLVRTTPVITIAFTHSFPPPALKYTAVYRVMIEQMISLYSKTLCTYYQKGFNFIYSQRKRTRNAKPAASFRKGWSHGIKTFIAITEIFQTMFANSQNILVFLNPWYRKIKYDQNQSCSTWRCMKLMNKIPIIGRPKQINTIGRPQPNIQIRCLPLQHRISRSP